MGISQSEYSNKLVNVPLYLSFSAIDEGSIFVNSHFMWRVQTPLPFLGNKHQPVILESPTDLRDLTSFHPAHIFSVKQWKLKQVVLALRVFF